MQGIERDDFPVQRPEVFEHRTRGGDFVALFLHQRAAQGPAAGKTDRADQLRLLFVGAMRRAATLGLAVDRDHNVDPRPQAGLGPLPQDAPEKRGIDVGEDPVKAGLLRALITAVAPFAKEQRPQLRLLLVRRFPYAVFYRIDPDAIRVVAVLHSKMNVSRLQARA